MWRGLESSVGKGFRFFYQSTCAKEAVLTLRLPCERAVIISSVKEFNLVVEQALVRGMYVSIAIVL